MGNKPIVILVCLIFLVLFIPDFNGRLLLVSTVLGVTFLVTSTSVLKEGRLGAPN